MGRTSLIMVIGFNLIFALLGFSLSRVGTDAYQNYVNYYNSSVARHIASSAANMASTQITFNPNWRTGYSKIAFGGGTFSTTVTNLDSARIQVNVSASYNNITASTVVVLGLTKFSKFAYYSKIEGAIYWITGDTVWGPFHTQQKLSVDGNPVFYGKVTAKNGMSKKNSSSQPQFYGGFQSGVDINLPGDFSVLKTYAQNGGRYFNKQDVYLKFNDDGTVTYRIGSWTAPPAYTMSVSAFAPNGVMMADNANLHVKGVLSGRLTISATGSSGASKGNVLVDSSVVYKNDPRTNTASTDMLGIVCDNDVVISDNSNNNPPFAGGASGVTIDATMLCRSGGLTAENYNKRGPSGTLTILGGIQQYQRGPVGTFDSNQQIVTGFQKNYRYDERLMIDSPPLYPTTGSYEVLSWYE